MKCKGHDSGGRTASLIRLPVLGLFFLDGTIVIDEDERALIVGIGVALSTFVAWAEIAGLVIIR